MKRMLSILLVIMMLVSMIPATVFAAETATLSFANKAQRTSFSTTKQVWQQNGITFTNDKATSNSNIGDYANPVRIYQNTTVTIEHEAGNISQIVFTAAGESKHKTALQNSLKGAGVTCTISGSQYTVNFDPAVESFTFKATAQTRLSALSVAYEVVDENACRHEGFETYEGEDGVAASCTASGLTATVYCSNCNEAVTGQQIIPALPHNIVDGACEDCGAVAYVLVTDVAELHVGSQIVIVATEFATTISTNQASNNRTEAAVTKAEDGSYVSFGANAQVLTVEAGAEVGTYAFNTGSGYLYAAGGTANNYLRTKAELDAAGSWTIEISEEGVATIKCADAAITRNWLRYNDNNKIFSCYGSGQKDIAIYILPVAEEPGEECDHLGQGTYEGDDYVAPTCYTTGMSATIYCANCDEVVKESEPLPISHEGYETYVEDYIAPTCTVNGETGITYCSNCDQIVAENKPIPATGHDYEDGACNNCGESVPVATLMTELPKTNDVVLIYNIAGQVMGSTMSGVRVAAVAAKATDGQIQMTDAMGRVVIRELGNDQYAFVINDKFVTSDVAGNAMSLENTLTECGKWTFEAEGTTAGTWYIRNVGANYNGNHNQALEYYSGFTTYGIKTTDAYKMQVYFVEAIECDHPSSTQQNDAVAPTCINVGYTATATCDICGAVTTEATIIDPTGIHTYENASCTGCKKVDPASELVAQLLTELPKKGDEVVIFSNGHIMTATAAGKKLAGVPAEVLENGNLPYNADVVKMTVSIDAEGYYAFQNAEGAYLTSGETGNSLTFAAELTDLAKWTIEAAVEGESWYITNKSAVYNEQAQGLEYFGGFTSYGMKEEAAYQMQLFYTSRKPAVVEMDGEQYISFEDAYAYDPDTTIKLLVDFDEINVTGDLYLDLNGHTVGSVTANHVFAGDSSATVAAAGTGKLTTTSSVEPTETIGSTKYVALKDENGVYTFHVLDLKLSNVTLRTNKAGIYYKAELACDEVLKAAIASHGVAVSVVKAPTAAFENDENTAYTQIVGAPEGIFTSGSITNIFRAGLSDEKNAARGEMKIYANAYLKLEDGSVLMCSNPSAKSMKDVMEYLNTNFATLEVEVQENAKAFYAQWADVMTAWNLENLAAAIVPAVPEEEEEQA